MNTITKSLMSVIGAAAMMLSVSLPADASWSTPNSSDLNSALANAVVEVSQLKVLNNLRIDQVKIVNVEDLLTAGQVIDLKNSLNNVLAQTQILTLQNVLKTINIVDVLNGNSILNFENLLNQNDFFLKDVIAVNVLDDGNVLVFCCP